MRLKKTFPFYSISYKFIVVVFALLFLTNLTAFSQTVSGIVISGNEKLSGAIIQNKRLNVSIVTGTTGAFTIKAETGDTLITKCGIYETDTSIVDKKYYLFIRLRQYSILKEVVIRSTSLNPLEKYNQNKEEYKDIYWKGDESKMVSISVGTIAGININIDKLYSALSKQGKDARKLQRRLTNDYKSDMINSRFSDTLVSRITGYREKKLNDFILKYSPGYEFIVKASDYEIIAYIKQKMAEESK